MHLYRFINPSFVGADKCVIIVSATNVEAINAYVDKFYPGCYSVRLSKDFHRGNAIKLEVSLKMLHDGMIIFSPIFTLDIN